MIIRILISAFLLNAQLFAEEPNIKPLQENVVESSGQLLTENGTLQYLTVAGNLVLKDDQGKDKASLFYTAYFLKGTTSTKDRPIAFCFNGGPGAASAWLNIGFLGPKCVQGEDVTYQNPPYTLVDNPDTLLNITDLVFIDPVSTGYSVAAFNQDPKKFYTLEEDILLTKDFIRLFTGKYKRWDSPKFIIGESYGAMRAVKVSNKLHEDDAYYTNGLLLISPALDLQAFTMNDGNEYPYIFFLPTYAAAASYHNVKPETRRKGYSIWQEAARYAEDRYVNALFKGNHLDSKEKELIADELSHMTGLARDVIMDLNLRIPPNLFRKKLLQKQDLIIGRFDARISGFDSRNYYGFADYDPSLDAIFGAITGAYNQYLVKELKWPATAEYKTLVSLNEWNWGKANQYANAITELRALLSQNPTLKVFVAAGIYDLAIPLMGTEYSLSHIDLGKSVLKDRLNFRVYEAGHMMYLNHAVREKLRKDINFLFYTNF